MKKFVYLATPYSKWPGGIEEAFQLASKYAGLLLKQGYSVYSPIAHTHPLAVYAKIDPYDHSIWMPFDEAMMDHADRLIVVMMEGWKESKGIAHEIEYFTKQGKEVLYIEPPKE